jgi:hypothetical protein
VTFVTPTRPTVRIESKNTKHFLQRRCAAAERDETRNCQRMTSRIPRQSRDRLRRLESIAAQLAESAQLAEIVNSKVGKWEAREGMALQMELE